MSEEDELNEIPKDIAPIISQKEAVSQFISYAAKRAKGEIPLYKTCYDNLNKAIGGSFEGNSILTIGGMSGSGKSAMAKRIIYSINQNLEAEGRSAVTLCFNYEMLAFKTLGREIANASKKSTSTLYSIDKSLDLEELANIQRYIMPKLLKYEMYYVEEPGTHVGIKKTIWYYWQKFCKDAGQKDKLFIVEIDHTLLIKAHGDNVQDKNKIDRLMNDLVALKKRIHSNGGQCLFIVISQLNRNIESIDRIRMPNMHRPGKSDLTNTDSAYQCSDYVIIGHQPAKLNLESYTEKGMPVSIYTSKKDRKKLNFIYYHVLKNREGEPDTTACMIGNLKYYEFIEVTPEKLVTYMKDSKMGDIYLDTPKEEPFNEEDALN